MESSHHHPHFIPALGLHGLTPLYDLFTKLIRERSLKQQLVDQAQVEPGMRVLDVGCGTGTLLLQLRETHPDAELVGLDIDPEVLELARKKLAQSRVTLHCGPLQQAPLEPASFDRVTSSLMMHHLEPDQKVEVLQAALRLLRPGGEVHVLDIAPPHTLAARVAFAPLGALVRQERMRVHLDGRFPESLRRAGFVDVQQIAARATLFGTLGYFRARRP